MLCGTEPFPEKFKAKKYKLHDHFITKKSFFQMMTNLPEEVTTVDGCLKYKEITMFEGE